MAEQQTNDVASAILDQALARAAELYEAAGRTDVAYALTKNTKD